MKCYAPGLFHPSKPKDFQWDLYPDFGVVLVNAWCCIRSTILRPAQGKTRKFYVKMCTQNISVSNCIYVDKPLSVACMLCVVVTKTHITNVINSCKTNASHARTLACIEEDVNKSTLKF